MVREVVVSIGAGTFTDALREGLHELKCKPSARPGYGNALQVYVANETHELHTRDRAKLLTALRQVDVHIADLMKVDLIDFVTHAFGFITFAVDEILAD